jgi:hypothetical protein
MLTKAMRKYVETEDKKGYNKSEYDTRLTKYATGAIEDLTFLAHKLPEDLQDELFGEKLLKFFEALFSFSPDYFEDKNKEVLEQRRRRLLMLSHGMILRVFGDMTTAHILAPDMMQRLLKGEAYETALKAIMMKSLSF